MSCKRKRKKISKPMVIAGSGGPRGVQGLKGDKGEPGDNGDPGTPGINNFIASYGARTDGIAPVTLSPAPGTVVPGLTIVVGAAGSPARFISAWAAFAVTQEATDALANQTVIYALRVTDANGSRIIAQTMMTVDKTKTESGSLTAREAVAAGVVTVELLHRAISVGFPGPQPTSGAFIIDDGANLVVHETLK